MPTTNYAGHMEDELEEIAAPPPTVAAYNSSTDFFTDEPEEKAIIRRTFCYQHTDAVDSGGPYSITIADQGESFIDPSSFRLRAELRVRKRVAGTLTDLDGNDATLVAPVNLFGKALLEQVDVFLKGKMISRISSPHYGIKAYLETLCSYGKDAQDGHLNVSYFHKDVPNQQDTIADNKFSASSFAERHKFIALSRKVHINEPIHTELATMNKLIPSHLPIEFRFNINRVNKILQYKAGDYEIKFSKFYVVYETVDLAPKLLYEIESKLSAKKEAIFPICRGLVRTNRYPENYQSILWSNLYQGVLPETITICLLDSEAYDGVSSKNYFNFQHFNLAQIELKKNSIPVAPIDLKADFENGEAKDLYRHFFDNMGIGTSNTPALITYEDFIGGSLIIPFDLTSDKCALAHNHTKYSGNVDLEIRFAKPLEKGITVIALCSFTDKFFVTGPAKERVVKMLYNI